MSRDLSSRNPTDDAIQGFILAGGASRRMGRDKAQLLLNGQTFLARIANELRVLTTSIHLVQSAAASGSTTNSDAGPINDPSGSSMVEPGALPVITDVFPDWGALGGLHAGLAKCRTGWAAVIACDLPFVTSKLWRRLDGFREDYDAVAPIQEDGRPQPLCALYRIDPCLSVADRLIKSGERKPVSLLQSVQTRWVAFAEVADLAGASRFFDNINTPADYKRATERSGFAKD
jgi:molybdenum cofactor guanylyltransferase